MIRSAVGLVTSVTVAFIALGDRSALAETTYEFSFPQCASIPPSGGWDYATTSANHRNICRLGDTVLVCWSDPEMWGGTPPYVTRSLNGGTTFETSQLLEESEPQAAGICLASGSNRDVFVIWSCGWIWFQSSSDGGEVFSEPIGVDFYQEPWAIQFHPSMYVDTEGVIYIAWSDERDGRIDIRMTKSLDGGESFLPGQVVSTGGFSDLLDHGRTAIAVDGEWVYIAAELTAPGFREVYIARSNDGGETFLPNAISLPCWFERVGGLAVDPWDDVYFAGVGWVGGEWSVGCAKGTDHAGQFDSCTRVNDAAIPDEHDANPSLALDGSGSLYITWDTYSDVWFSKSEDGATSFGPSTCVSGVNGGRFGTVVADEQEHALVAFSGPGVEGGRDIYFTRGVPEVQTPAVAEGGSTENACLVLHQNAPNPFSSATEIRYDLDSPGNIRLAIYDVRGRLVRIFTEGAGKPGSQVVVWDGVDARGAMVSPGIYVCRLDTEGRTQSRKMIRVR